MVRSAGLSGKEQLCPYSPAGPGYHVNGDPSPDALQGTGMFKRLTGGDTIDAEIKLGGRIQLQTLVSCSSMFYF